MKMEDGNEKGFQERKRWIRDRSEINALVVVNGGNL
jgi:hypothetical protein